MSWDLTFVSVSSFRTAVEASSSPNKSWESSNSDISKKFDRFYAFSSRNSCELKARFLPAERNSVQPAVIFANDVQDTYRNSNITVLLSISAISTQLGWKLRVGVESWSWTKYNSAFLVVHDSAQLTILPECSFCTCVWKFVLLDHTLYYTCAAQQQIFGVPASQSFNDKFLLISDWIQDHKFLPRSLILIFLYPRTKQPDSISSDGQKEWGWWRREQSADACWIKSWKKEFLYGTPAHGRWRGYPAGGQGNCHRRRQESSRK